MRGKLHRARFSRYGRIRARYDNVLIRVFIHARRIPQRFVRFQRIGRAHHCLDVPRLCGNLSGRQRYALVSAGIIERGSIQRYRRPCALVCGIFRGSVHLEVVAHIYAAIGGRSYVEFDTVDCGIEFKHLNAFASRQLSRLPHVIRNISAGPACPHFAVHRKALRRNSALKHLICGIGRSGCWIYGW